MDLELNGKAALVTGGSRGIGKAVAHRLAKEGASVALVARDAAVLNATAEELRRETGATIIALAGDTGSDSAVKQVVAQAAELLGGLDIVVNSAATAGGTAGAPKFDEIGEDVLWPEINVKVLGYLRVIREAVPHLRARGGGRIINISGLAARATGSIVGSVRNIAVSAMTKNLADELAPDNIAVVVVHPAFTDTERTPAVLAALAQRLGITAEEAKDRTTSSMLLGRLVRADEIADVVAFLASPKAAPINGDAIAVGGGTRGVIVY